jgi:cell division protein FtsW (lipid II flippase)
MSARTVRALLIANVLVLCVLGLIMMYSAGSYNALLDAETSPLEEVMTQGAFMMLGLAAMFGLSFLDYRRCASRWCSLRRFSCPSAFCVSCWFRASAFI